MQRWVTVPLPTLSPNTLVLNDSIVYAKDGQLKHSGNGLIPQIAAQQMAQSVQNAAKAQASKQVLRDIYKASDNEYSKQLLAQLVNTVGDVDVQVVENLNQVDSQTADKIKAGGYYFTNQNKLLLYPNSKDWYASAIELANHELSHVLTYDLIISGNLDHRVQQQLEQVHQALLPTISSMFNNEQAVDDAILERLSYAYFTDVPHELLSVLASETQVRAALEQHNADLLNKFDKVYQHIINQKENSNEQEQTRNPRNHQAGADRGVSETTNTHSASQSIRANEHSVSTDSQASVASVSQGVQSNQPKTYTLSQLKKSVEKLSAPQQYKQMFAMLTQGLTETDIRYQVADIKNDNGEVMVGSYDPKTKVLTLGKALFAAQGKDTFKLITLNHELVHALTEHNILQNRPEHQKAIKDLTAMKQQVIAQWEQDKGKDSLLDEVMLAVSEDNGISEFVAYGMTHPALMKYIDSVLTKNSNTNTNNKTNTKPSTALTKFIAAVKSLLGLKAVGFTRFASTVEQIMSTPQAVTGDTKHSASAMKSVQANIKRGQKRMNDVITTKADVKRAMFRNDIGWIDFVWGDVGITKANGKTKGGKGISHIIEARMRKDNMSYDEVVAFLTDKVPQVIAQGEVLFENDRKMELHDGDNLVVLKKEKGANDWVITAFELYEHRKSDGGHGVESDTVMPTHDSSTRASSNIVGASDKNSLAQNPQIRYSKAFDEQANQSTKEVFASLGFDGSPEFNERLNWVINEIYDTTYDTLDVDSQTMLDALAHNDKLTDVGITYQLSDKEALAYAVASTVLSSVLENNNDNSGSECFLQSTDPTPLKIYPKSMLK